MSAFCKIKFVWCMNPQKTYAPIVNSDNFTYIYIVCLYLIIYYILFDRFLYFDGRHEITSIKPNSALNSNHRTPQKNTKCLCFHLVPKFRNQQKKHIVSALAPPTIHQNAVTPHALPSFQSIPAVIFFGTQTTRGVGLERLQHMIQKWPLLAEVLCNNPPGIWMHPWMLRRE